MTDCKITIDHDTELSKAEVLTMVARVVTQTQDSKDRRPCYCVHVVHDGKGYGVSVVYDMIHVLPMRNPRVAFV